MSSTRLSSNPASGALAFGLLGLGAAVWFVIQLTTQLDNEALKKAFDAAATCSATVISACRQVGSGTVTDLFLYNNGRAVRKGSRSLGSCQLSVLIGADRYETYMSTGPDCHSLSKGVVTPMVVFDGKLMLVGGRPTRDNPDWAVNQGLLYLYLAGFLTLFGVIPAVILGARWLTDR